MIPMMPAATPSTSCVRSGETVTPNTAAIRTAPAAVLGSFRRALTQARVPSLLVPIAFSILVMRGFARR